MRKTKAAKPSATATILRPDWPDTPPMPSPPPSGAMTEWEIAAAFDAAAARNHQRNLDNAVRLAHQAAARHGPLVEHFAELGRRFGEQAEKPVPPRLRIVKGTDGPGAAA